MYSVTSMVSSSGRLRRVGLTMFLASALVAANQPATGQNTGRLTGGFAGRTESEQLWSQPVETSRRPGFLFGAFFDVPTPVTLLRVRAEAGFAQRGGYVSSDFRGDAIDGEVRSDYLSFHLQGKVSGSVGPLHVFAAAGPGFDYLVGSREDPVLDQVLVEQNGTVFKVGAGAGAGVRIGDGWVAEVEGRWVEGLSRAYSGSFLSVRNRSMEWVLRVARVARPVVLP